MRIRISKNWKWHAKSVLWILFKIIITMGHGCYFVLCHQTSSIQHLPRDHHHMGWYRQALAKFEFWHDPCGRTGRVSSITAPPALGHYLCHHPPNTCCRHLLNWHEYDPSIRSSRGRRGGFWNSVRRGIRKIRIDRRISWIQQILGMKVMTRG